MSINNKLNIDGIIVVEGETDKKKLIKLINNLQIITTNGSALNDKTLNLIQLVAKTKKVILFLDPDYMGEKIRKQICTKLKDVNLYNAFIKKDDMETNQTKIGIAEATDTSIINALKNMVSFNTNSNSISLDEYNELNIDSKTKRLKICNHFKISYCNNKQLLKRLNMMNLNKQDILKVINNEW